MTKRDEALSSNELIAVLEAATNGDLGARLATRDDERGALVRAVNDLLGATEARTRRDAEVRASLAHDLRAPLNSVLILSQLLADDANGTLSAREVEFARTIHASGLELLGTVDRLLGLPETPHGAPRGPRKTPSVAPPGVLADRAPGAGAKPGPSLSGLKVLVIDDDIRNIFAITSVLESRHASVLFAENGAEGLALLDANPDVDAVLTDVMMPEMDGYEVMRRVRSDAKHAALPIVALTARAMKSDRDKCLAAGATDYLAKPIDVDRLVTLLAELP